MMPALFTAHGSPMLAIEDNEYHRFLQGLGQQYPKPQAIVMFTAHWESEHPAISFIEGHYDTIYDFGGFSPELYAIKYPAKGSLKVAGIVEERFKHHGIACSRDHGRGLDHGSWVVLHLMYPNADIPVVQVSVNPYLPAIDQFKIGEALRGLGKEDVMVIGSGGTVHNLRTVKWGHTFEVETWAKEFDDWLLDAAQNRDLDALFDYEKLAPHARLAVPRAEHFVPFFIAMGSGEESKQPKVLHRSYDLGTLSHLCVEF